MKLAHYPSSFGTYGCYKKAAFRHFVQSLRKAGWCLPIKSMGCFLRVVLSFHQRVTPALQLHKWCRAVSGKDLRTSSCSYLVWSYHSVQVIFIIKLKRQLMVMQH